MTRDLHDDETLDEHDLSRASDMDANRPIYSVTINLVVRLVQKSANQTEHAEEVSENAREAGR